MRRRRTNDVLDGDREAGRIALVLGANLRVSRRRLTMTQEQLGDRVGVKRSRISQLERGLGGSAPLLLWARLGMAVGKPLAVAFSRDLEAAPEPVDGGHLVAQELLLQLARQRGRVGVFELPTGPSPVAGVVDVAMRDDEQEVLILAEVWNRLTDFGAASRSTSRKVADASSGILPRGFRLASCWLLIDTAANRAIVRRYPEIIRARFQGSSVRWVRALIDGADHPSSRGLSGSTPGRGDLPPCDSVGDGIDRSVRAFRGSIPLPVSFSWLHRDQHGINHPRSRDTG